MNSRQIMVLVLVLVVVGALIGVKTARSRVQEASETLRSDRKLPRLLDLGSEGCTACERMKPILAELRAELRGKVDVEFIDIAKDAAAADRYEVQAIPVQIYFDAQGNEVARHVGFCPKADIMAQLQAMGVR